MASVFYTCLFIYLRLIRFSLLGFSLHFTDSLLVLDLFLCVPLAGVSRQSIMYNTDYYRYSFFLIFTHQFDSFVLRN